MYLNSSDDNSIYFNNFINNNRHLFSNDSLNTWNSPGKFNYTYKGANHTNYLGNYWDNYTGSDTNNDGIGETPFIIGGDIDNYPLMEPIE
jgi:nitrous oxidase accessory protein NosD